MKKILSYIITYTAIILFLASSTGVSFIVHHCSENHTSEIHLFVSDYKCQHEQNDLEGCCSSKNEKTSCTKLKHNHYCCSNKKGYIKIFDKFNISRENYLFNDIVFSELSNFNFSHTFSDFINFPISYRSPPIFIGGKQLIRFISAFLI